MLIKLSGNPKNIKNHGSAKKKKDICQSSQDTKAIANLISFKTIENFR